MSHVLAKGIFIILIDGPRIPEIENSPLSSNPLMAQHQIDSQNYARLQIAMRPNVGDVFPLLGYQGRKAIVKFGGQMMSVPLECINYVLASDNKRAEQQYAEKLQSIVAASATIDAQKQQRTLEEIRDELSRIRRLQQ